LYNFLSNQIDGDRIKLDEKNDIKKVPLLKKMSLLIENFNDTDRQWNSKHELFQFYSSVFQIFAAALDEVIMENKKSNNKRLYRLHDQIENIYRVLFNRLEENENVIESSDSIIEELLKSVKHYKLSDQGRVAKCVRILRQLLNKLNSFESILYGL